MSDENIPLSVVQDSNVQSRLVRLLCVFLMALLRDGALDPDDLALELQTFCIHFSRVRCALCPYSVSQHAGR